MTLWVADVIEWHGREAVESNYPEQHPREHARNRNDDFQ